MSTQDLENAISTMNTKFDKLASDLAALATAEQANGLPTLRATVVADKTDIENTVVSTLGLSSQVAVFLTNALPPAQAKTALAVLLTSAGTLQAK